MEKTKEIEREANKHLERDLDRLENKVKVQEETIKKKNERE